MRLLPRLSSITQSSRHPFGLLVLPTCQIWPPGPWCNVSNYDVVSTGLSPRSVLGYVPYWCLYKTPWGLWGGGDDGVTGHKWQGCQGRGRSLSLCFNATQLEVFWHGSQHFNGIVYCLYDGKLAWTCLWQHNQGFQVKRRYSAHSNQVAFVLKPD